MNNEELNILVSSDPSQGAFNRSSDGSYFEIFLQDNGIQIPRTAKSCYLSCEEATVWWSVPNIITGINDKMYITGPSGVELTTNHDLGYDQLCTIEANGSAFTISGGFGGEDLPLGVFITGDILKVEETGEEYPVGTILTNTITSFSFLTTNTTVLAQNAGNFDRLRGGDGIVNYVITLPQGLYDLNLMNNAIATQLENAGASSDSEPVISLSADIASQRVQIRFPFPSSSVDFTQSDTFRGILGFNSGVYGPYSTAPITQTAQNTASFNQVNYFLLHSDLCSRGIRFNNQYTQVVSQILITASPGSQIVSTPFNPAKINTNELIGATRSSIRVWITDDQNRRINTNGEYFSARLKLQYHY